MAGKNLDAPDLQDALTIRPLSGAAPRQKTDRSAQQLLEHMLDRNGLVASDEGFVPATTFFDTTPRLEGGWRLHDPNGPSVAYRLSASMQHEGDERLTVGVPVRPAVTASREKQKGETELATGVHQQGHVVLTGLRAGTRVDLELTAQWPVVKNGRPTAEDDGFTLLSGHFAWPADPRGIVQAPVLMLYPDTFKQGAVVYVHTSFADTISAVAFVCNLEDSPYCD